MMPSSSGPGIRHGSGAQVQSSGTRSRIISRDRRGSESRVSSTPIRSASRQMGPQETTEWDTMFDNIMSRVSALERSQRAQGQTLADTRGHVSQLKHDFDATVADIGEFKTWVVGRLSAIETITERKFNETDAAVVVAQNHFVDADARFTRLEDAVNRTMTSLGVLQSTLRDSHNTTRPLQYNMSTPITQPHAPPGKSADTNLLDLSAEPTMPSQAQLNQAFPSVGQSVPPIAHGQAAYPSHIQGPTIPGSFQRPDVPKGRHWPTLADMSVS